MIPENFEEALLRSAKSEAPAAHAKERAMAALEHVLGELAPPAAAAAAGNGALAAAKTLTTAKIAVAAAVVAGAAGLGGGYELGRSTAPPPAPLVAEHAASTPTPSALVIADTRSRPAPSASVQAKGPAAADVCAAIEATATNKCSAAKTGQSVTFALKSGCSEATLDLFWVDESCHEIFKGLVGPGQTLWQDSWDSHVFRVRDHATHRLVSELTPTRVAGARDRDDYWKGPPTELPRVVLRESDAPIPETAPPECFRGGGRAAILHVKNERKSSIALMRVDLDCSENNMPRLIAPGTTFDTHTSEGHAFRVRDASGALLLDIVPTILDTTTYLSVP
jgi:hypothetical protein